MNIMGASDKALGALIVLYFLRTGQATKIPWAGNIFFPGREQIIRPNMMTHQAEPRTPPYSFLTILTNDSVRNRKGAEQKKPENYLIFIYNIYIIYKYATKLTFS